jgi:hypothetical protein
VSIVAISCLAALTLSPLLAPTSVSLPYKAGNAGSYATGSTSFATFTLQHTAVLTGAFVTNASADVNIEQLSMPSALDQCQNLNGYCYTTGDVNHATLDTTLPAGTYKLVVTFTNDTTAQTWFNITQSFVAAYQK